MLIRAFACAMLSLVLGVFIGNAQAQSRTIFSGVPSVKIIEGGTDRLAEKVPQNQAVKFRCDISEIGGRYYWTTRENKELLQHESGSFITFVAVDGSGYVRVIAPEAKRAAALMSPTEANFDYVEHMLMGLRSVTYFGTATK